MVDAHATPVAGPALNDPGPDRHAVDHQGVGQLQASRLSLQHNPDITGSGAETVTATVQVDNGTGTFVNAPDGTVVTLTIDAFEHGGELTFTGGVTSTTCATSGGTCTAQINATSTGTTIVDAHASPQARTGREHDRCPDRLAVDHENVGQLEDHALAPAQPGHHG